MFLLSVFIILLQILSSNSNLSFHLFLLLTVLIIPIHCALVNHDSKMLDSRDWKNIRDHTSQLSYTPFFIIYKQDNVLPSSLFFPSSLFCSSISLFSIFISISYLFSDLIQWHLMQMYHCLFATLTATVMNISGNQSVVAME